ncbi:GFA family protein [Rhodovulum sulfidophilum]|uniref:GFA family protein n=1 Tax=Rhodovulum sulfidophilum TaxID=35806 RepID=UPI001921B79B|nr:GFA family protein [Rhodovulum sulfidophilum]MBL3564857.1 GFA family protein [Rhodovulum sulfidophilum]
MTVTGSCLCGRVRYRIDGPLSPVVACHCSQCRKASGHHVAATTVMRDDLVIEGEVRWYASSAGAQRGFCPVCGSNLFWDGGQDYLAVFAGTLDGDPGIRMAAHIFCADKGAYYEITDGLPQAPGLPEDIA